ncbi:MAG: Na/Pi cotransporter family protein [bacterium]
MDMNMVIEMTFGLMGGLGLFIYGVHLMGEGLQKAAGDRMRKILSKLTDKPVLGVLVGAGITAIIQSSSATSVMLVGFVNAGLMSLTQAVGVIMGANIGTTVTGQIIAFKLTNLALPAIGIGFGLSFFSKNKKIKNCGEVILGFGILFLGLKIMMDSVKFLRSNQSIANTFVFIGNKEGSFFGPILGVLGGMFITMIIQSSSATIGLLIALSRSKLISIDAAIPILLGDNIGTCITALLASIGTSLSAKRTASAHAAFNILGTVIILILLGPYKRLIIFLSKGNIPRQIANAHTLFNVMNTIILLPFISYFIKFVTFIIPGKEPECRFTSYYLDKRLIRTPVIALEQVKKEILRMARIAESMIHESIDALLKKDGDKLKDINHKEGIVDLLQKEITDYLVELSQESITQEVSKKINSSMRMVNNIERIGDHAENLAKVTNRKLTGNASFTNEALQDVKVMYQETSDFYKDIIEAIEKEDKELANSSLQREKRINKLNYEFRNKNIHRLNKGKSDVISGLIFSDIITHFEKIGDHSFNIGEAVLGIK